MTDKTCSTCIWYDKYMDHGYGFCHKEQIWVDGNKNCEVHSDVKSETGTADRMERL